MLVLRRSDRSWPPTACSEPSSAGHARTAPSTCKTTLYTSAQRAADGYAPCSHTYHTLTVVSIQLLSDLALHSCPKGYPLRRYVAVILEPKDDDIRSVSLLEGGISYAAQITDADLLTYRHSRYATTGGLSSREEGPSRRLISTGVVVGVSSHGRPAYQWRSHTSLED